MSPASDRAKIFVGIFSKISNLGDSGISLFAFSSRTKMKLHNIPLSIKLDREVMTNLDYSGVPGLICVPVVVLKKCEPELSYILAQCFDLYLKESWFRIFGKSHLWLQYLRIFGTQPQLKITTLLFFFYSSSHSITHLLTVLSEINLRTFSRYGSTQVVALDTSNNFDRVWHTGLFHKLKSYGNSSRFCWFYLVFCQ